MPHPHAIRLDAVVAATHLKATTHNVPSHHYATGLYEAARSRNIAHLYDLVKRNTEAAKLEGTHLLIIKSCFDASLCEDLLTFGNDAMAERQIKAAHYVITGELPT